MSAAKYNCHIHVTVTKRQRAKLVARSSRTGVPISVLVRGLIDDMEVSK